MLEGNWLGYAVTQTGKQTDGDTLTVRPSPDDAKIIVNDVKFSGGPVSVYEQHL